MFEASGWDIPTVEESCALLDRCSIPPTLQEKGREKKEG